MWTSKTLEECLTSKTLEAWLSSKESESFFGLDRGKSQLPDGRWLVADINVSDITSKSWKERLFSRPWNPFKGYKKTPRAYVVKDIILVSFETYRLIKAGKEKLPLEMR